MKLRQQLGEVLARIRLRGEEFIIEKGGEPQAVMISYKKIEMIRRHAAEETINILEDKSLQGSNTDLSDEELESFVNRAIHESRRS